MNLKRPALAVAVGLLLGIAHASPLPLLGRDINGIPVDSRDPTAAFEYDPNLDITWLRDWDYLTTSGYALGNRLQWHEAMAWAQALTIGSFGGWSLPTTVWPDSSCVALPASWGFVDYYSNCRGSPLGYMWYEELGNDTTWLYGGPVNAGPFVNMQTDYWSSTSTDGGVDRAWNFWGGMQGLDPTHWPHFNATVVRAGDLATVAEPLTGALCLVALLAAACVRRLRPRV